MLAVRINMVVDGFPNTKYASHADAWRRQYVAGCVNILLEIGTLILTNKSA
jgi:hypothetical protein